MCSLRRAIFHSSRHLAAARVRGACGATNNVRRVQEPVYIPPYSRRQYSQMVIHHEDSLRSTFIREPVSHIRYTMHFYRRTIASSSSPLRRVDVVAFQINNTRIRWPQVDPTLSAVSRTTKCFDKSASLYAGSFIETISAVGGRQGGSRFFSPRRDSSGALKPPRFISIYYYIHMICDVLRDACTRFDRDGMREIVVSASQFSPSRCSIARSLSCLVNFDEIYG